MRGGEEEIEVLIVGDAVAGKGIFRGQEFINLLQLGNDQVLYAAWKLRQWVKNVQIASQCDNVRVSLVLGHHDHSNRDNLCIQLVAMLHLMDVNARYCGEEYIGEFGDGRKFLALHGFGRSSYYPASYAEIRDTWKNIIGKAVLSDGKVVVNRVLFGHTHWYNVGLNLAPGLSADVLGGFNRVDKLRYGYAWRPSGMIVYYGASEVIPIEADLDLLQAELGAGDRLKFDNLRDIAETMGDVFAWGKERGFLA